VAQREISLKRNKCAFVVSDVEETEKQEPLEYEEDADDADLNSRKSSKSYGSRLKFRHLAGVPLIKDNAIISVTMMRFNFKLMTNNF
jgi:hypothetical protein